MRAELALNGLGISAVAADGTDILICRVCLAVTLGNELLLVLVNGLFIDLNNAFASVVITSGNVYHVDRTAVRKSYGFLLYRLISLGIVTKCRNLSSLNVRAVGAGEGLFSRFGTRRCFGKRSDSGEIVRLHSGGVSYVAVTATVNGTSISSKAVSGAGSRSYDTRIVGVTDLSGGLSL